MNEPEIRARRARYLNQIVDEALLAPTRTHIRQLLALPEGRDPAPLAERVRRRASVLMDNEPNHNVKRVEVRDQLIQTLYAARVPRGWHCAWCDGSADGAGVGIGVIITDAEGEIVAKVADFGGDKPPFEAEIDALSATLLAARQHGITRLRIYTDCHALVRMWLATRHDARLSESRTRARHFRRLEIHPIRREHNQPAHNLAYRAALQPHTDKEPPIKE